MPHAAARPAPQPALGSPFGETSTAEEVSKGVDLSGARAIVTGASSGIGVETARVLALRGAEVTLAVRDPHAGERAAAEIRGSVPDAQLSVRQLDLAALSSVRAFASAWVGPVDILVNNAGVMALPERSLSPEGHELQFATNHLGHFALTIGLQGALAAAGSARVVAVSSSAHLVCPMLFDDPAFAFVPYTPLLGYGQSKTANVLFAVEADRRWRADGIRAFSLMPGAIETNLQRHIDPDVLAAERAASGAGASFKSVAQGAATSVFAATSPLLDGHGGLYLEDCGEAAFLTARDQSDGRHGLATYAVDPVHAEALWELSERWVTAAR